MTLENAIEMVNEYRNDMKNGLMESQALFIMKKDDAYRVACGEREFDRAIRLGYELIK